MNTRMIRMDLGHSGGNLRHSSRLNIMPTKTTPSVRMLYKGVDVDNRTEKYILKRIQKVTKVLKKILEYEVQVSMDKKGKFSIAFMVKTPYELYRTEERSESRSRCLIL